MIYQVECDKGHRYTVETEPIRDESHLRPYQCGACGSKDIRVWALVYGLVTKARLTVIAPAHPVTECPYCGLEIKEGNNEPFNLGDME